MLSEKQQRMVALFEKHVGAELAGDLDTTIATMSDDPHLNHVPTMAGGVGRDGRLPPAWGWTPAGRTRAGGWCNVRR